MVQNEYIVCAAMYYKAGKPNEIYYANIPKNKGQVILCLNHEFNTLASLYPSVKCFACVEQGFMTNKRRFVSRKEASKIAFEAKQIEVDKGYLFSEDLY